MDSALSNESEFIQVNKTSVFANLDKETIDYEGAAVNKNSEKSSQTWLCPYSQWAIYRRRIVIIIDNSFRLYLDATFTFNLLLKIKQLQAYKSSLPSPPTSFEPSQWAAQTQILILLWKFYSPVKMKQTYNYLAVEK